MKASGVRSDALQAVYGLEPPSEVSRHRGGFGEEIN